MLCIYQPPDCLIALPCDVLPARPQGSRRTKLGLRGLVRLGEVEQHIDASAGEAVRHHVEGVTGSIWNQEGTGIVLFWRLVTPCNMAPPLWGVFL